MLAVIDFLVNLLKILALVFIIVVSTGFTVSMVMGFRAYIKKVKNDGNSDN